MLQERQQSETKTLQSTLSLESLISRAVISIEAFCLAQDYIENEYDPRILAYNSKLKSHAERLDHVYRALRD
jgi:hypothetical protein